MTTIPIGTLARKAGVKVPTIRFYEQIGLLPAPPRTGSNRRSYGPEHVRKLRFIRHARTLGFGMEDVRTLLALATHPQDACHHADSIAHRHLETINRRIAQLRALRGELKRMIAACERGERTPCRVIEALAEEPLPAFADGDRG